MGEAAKKIMPLGDKKISEDILETIKKRQLSELVFGFCGAAGAGVSTISESLEKCLSEYRYETITIRISDLLFEEIEKYKTEINFNEDIKVLHTDKSKRGKVLQDLGDHLREKFGNSILSQLAIKQIAIEREKIYEKHGEKLFVTNEKTKKEEIKIIPDIRIAWFIDSFKNPEEVNVFRSLDSTRKCNSNNLV